MMNKEATLCFAFNLLTMPEDPRGFAKFLHRRRSTKYSRTNQSAVNRRNRDSRKKHPETQRVWRKINRETYNEYFTTPERRAKRNPYLRVWGGEQRRTNPQYRIAAALRTRVSQALNGNPKASTTQKLLGCSWAVAVAAIEKTFRPGMTWENHGKVWHIDHSRPCASFDLTNPEEQRACFHYTNLQALPILENLQKGAKWPSP